RRAWAPPPRRGRQRQRPPDRGLQPEVPFEGTSPPPVYIRFLFLRTGYAYAAQPCTSLQATQWPGRNSLKTGLWRRQPSTAMGQRGWKTQPGGGLSGLGTSPLGGWNSRIASIRGSGIGTADSRARV